MRRQQGSDTTRGIKQLTIGPTTRGIYSSLGSMELGNLPSEPKIRLVLVYEDHFFIELCSLEGYLFWCHARSAAETSQLSAVERLHETFHLPTNTYCKQLNAGNNSMVKALSSRAQQKWSIVNSSWHSNSLALHTTRSRQVWLLLNQMINVTFGRFFSARHEKKNVWKIKFQAHAKVQNSPNKRPKHCLIALMKDHWCRKKTTDMSVPWDFLNFNSCKNLFFSVSVCHEKV